MPLEECVSPHVVAACRDHVRLDWRMPYRTPERVRSLAWTCDCRSPVYELCEGGGQAFVRRTVRVREGAETHETPRWSLTQARVVWTALLSGRAR